MNSTDTKRIIEKYNNQLYVHKVDNSNFLKDTNYQN